MGIQKGKSMINKFENRYAIAFALKNKDDKYLFVFRNEKRKEYPNSWSLPSGRISESEYNYILENNIVPSKTAKKLVDECFVSCPNLEPKFLNCGTRQRENYRLNMILATDNLYTLPEVSDKKYSGADFFELKEALGKSNYIVGTCVSLLLNHMITIDYKYFDLSKNYIECSPEMYRENQYQYLDTIKTEELWEYNSSNYSLMIDRLSGTDGDIIRKLTIDRYLDKYFEEKNRRDEKIVDLGCGNGDLVFNLKNKGFYIKGLDLNPDPLGKYKYLSLEKGDIKNSHLIFKEKFSILVFNLVFPWIEDIEEVARTTQRIASDGARVIITLLPLEFSRDGRWIKYENEYAWESNKERSNRPFYTMINFSVGPVRYFPRSTYDYITAFSKCNFHLTMARYLHLDSMLDESEKIRILNDNTNISRFKNIPAFQILEFKKAG